MTADDIEFSERYDQEDDIYYVTIRTGEPSIADEDDDTLVLEMGIFTRMPTGFRIFGYSKHKAKMPGFITEFKEMCVKMGLRKSEASESWRQELTDARARMMAA